MKVVSVPRPGAHQSNSRWFEFVVREGFVGVAGSRRGNVHRSLSERLVCALHRLGFGVLVGCAPGVDAAVRAALVATRHVRGSLVACAFENRACRISASGLQASVVAPEGFVPSAALRYRTQWIIGHSSFLVLFPDDPNTGQWGRGSSLAYRSALGQGKPVFVVSSRPPQPSVRCVVLASDFLGVLTGIWVVPRSITLRYMMELAA